MSDSNSASCAAAGVQGSRHYSARFHRVLDAILSHQRHFGVLPVLSQTAVAYSLCTLVSWPKLAGLL